MKVFAKPVCIFSVLAVVMSLATSAQAVVNRNDGGVHFIPPEVIPDDTVYRIQRQLWSDPTHPLSNHSLSGKPVIRAIGQPGMDAIEILVIGETFIQSVKSTDYYFVISRYKRIK